MPATIDQDAPLLDQVRALRARGCSPKEIARALGMRPAAIAPLVRQAGQQARAAAPEPALVGCWVSPGWRTGLTVRGHPEWPDAPAGGDGSEGLGCVLVARRHPRSPQRVSVCGYLVDTFCLGVKNALGPRTMGDPDLTRFREKYFGAYDGEPVPAPLELARELVWGSIDYARALGFEPHPDFAAAAGHLGPAGHRGAITFGRHGKPCYVQGPYDDTAEVMRTLASTAGVGRFDFLARLESVAGGRTGYQPALGIVGSPR